MPRSKRVVYFKTPEAALAHDQKAKRNAMRSGYMIETRIERSDEKPGFPIKFYITSKTRTSGCSG